MKIIAPKNMTPESYCNSINCIQIQALTASLYAQNDTFYTHGYTTEGLDFKYKSYYEVVFSLREGFIL